MSTVTPMMRQYLEIKESNPDCILFFRLGDFYEMFGEDAITASKVLDIALTTRDRSSEASERMPMCGVPYHSAESRIAKLISEGYKVAICEQLEDPATATGIVERGVVRIITKGTIMDSSMLDEDKPNYLCCVYIGTAKAAACFAELTTGEISVTEFESRDIRQIENELASFSPSEALLLGDLLITQELAVFLKEQIGCAVELNATDCDGTIADEATESGIAINTLTRYLEETQKTDISHLQAVRHNNEAGYMEMDYNTIRSLELVMPLQMGNPARTLSDKKGSLLWVLDKAKTPMGRRLLRTWVLRPLLGIVPIKRRQSAVSELVSNGVIRGELINGLKKIGDIERMICRIAFGNVNARDLKALSDSINKLPELTAQLNPLQSSVMRECAAIDLLQDLAEKIDRTIQDEPGFSVREGGMIRDGVDSRIDHLRSLLDNREEVLLNIEQREKERTGKNLKVSHNKVFGYYIEITRSASDDVPDDYIRKQTLTNCERFITQELKELETELFEAKDDLASIEYKIFEELRLSIAAEATRVQAVARSIAELDVLCSFADVAVHGNYCMPEIDASGVISISDGRHPVVEKTQTDTLFVPNDTYLDTDDKRIAIVTGPNMAGKSTYMRQTALITLMAQMGSFVPASVARIGIVDRVFTRIGASDDISSGKSTFMVEMTEVADILKNATGASLLILDEIGRGTSTYDGMSVARAVLEHCADKRKLGAKTMFATHYHELALLEDEIEGIKNYNISAKKRGDEIIFLRKIVPGSADDSYGIEVAGLAGVPESVIKRAKEVLAELEDAHGAADIFEAATVDSRMPRKPVGAAPPRVPQLDQISLLDMGSNEIAQILGKTDLNTLTPLEALNLLYELKKKL